MVSRVPRRIGRLAAFGRLLLLVLAMAGQISSGALAQPLQNAAPAQSALQAAMVFCQAGSQLGKGGKPPAQHHLSDPAIAGAGLAFAQPVALAETGAVVPAPISHLIARTAPPEARGPPVRYARATYPTGPPFLV